MTLEILNIKFRRSEDTRTILYVIVWKTLLPFRDHVVKLKRCLGFLGTVPEMRLTSQD